MAALTLSIVIEDYILAGKKKPDQSPLLTDLRGGATHQFAKLESGLNAPHCVKYLISWNLRNHDTSRHSGNRRMKRDVSWNMTCSRVFCSLHVSWWRVSKNHSVGT